MTQNYTISTETDGINNFICIAVPKAAGLNMQEVRRLINGLNYGCLPCAVFPKSSQYLFRYKIKADATIEDLIGAKLTKGQVVCILNEVVSAAENVRVQGLSPENILFHKQYIYVDTVSNKLLFVYVPVLNQFLDKVSLKDFIADLMFSAPYDEKDDLRFYIKLQNYVACTEKINPAGLKEFLTEVLSDEDRAYVDKAIYRAGSERKGPAVYANAAMNEEAAENGTSADEKRADLVNPVPLDKCAEPTEPETDGVSVKSISAEEPALAEDRVSAKIPPVFEGKIPASGDDSSEEKMSATGDETSAGVKTPVSGDGSLASDAKTPANGDRTSAADDKNSAPESKLVQHLIPNEKESGISGPVYTPSNFDVSGHFYRPGQAEPVAAFQHAAVGAGSHSFEEKNRLKKNLYYKPGLGEMYTGSRAGASIIHSAGRESGDDGGTTVLYREEEGTTVLGYKGEAEPLKPFLVSMATGEEIVIHKDDFRLGRDPLRCDHVIRNPFVGRLHAKIVTEEGQYFIEDIFSRNGTFVNGERVKSGGRKKIKHEDTISLANESFVFRLY